MIAGSRRHKFAQRGQELSIQHCRPGATADGVVREDSELPVKQGTWAQAAHRSGHSLAAHAVQPGLRPVVGSDSTRSAGCGAMGSA